jgi:hypothetical protein
MSADDSVIINTELTVFKIFIFLIERKIKMICSMGNNVISDYGGSKLLAQ